MIYRIDVTISAPVRDTELESRVADAVLEIFPDAELVEEEGILRGEVHNLDHFSELLHRREILDTARGEFFSTLDGNTFSFSLKKQAAFRGVVTFAVGSPDELGTIDVHVTVDEPDAEAFIDHVAPRTEDGKPISSE